MQPEYIQVSSERQIKTNIEKFAISSIMIKVLAICLVCAAAAMLLQRIWTINAVFLHTIFESSCVFIALCAFATTWSIYDNNSPTDRIVGFGLLIVAVFDFFHIYFWPVLGLYPIGYFDLSVRFWILGRISEAIIFFLCSINLIKRNASRGMSLAFVLAFSAGVSALVILIPAIMPVMFVPPFTMTAPKILLEYAVILLFAISAYKLRRAHENRNFITNSYLLIVLLLAIPCEILFTLFKAYDSYTNVLGHILRMVYYFYLFKGIFASAIVYPHTQLKEYSRKIEEMNEYTTNLLDKLPSAFVYCNKNIGVVYINKKAEEILGYKSSELYGRHVNDMVQLLFMKEYPENIDYVNSLVNEGYDKRISKALRLKTNGGDLRNVIVESYKMENGDFISFFTETKEEQSLSSLRLQTQTILNSMNKLVIVTDYTNKVILCNKVFMEYCELADITGESLNVIANTIPFEMHPQKENPGKACKDRDEYEIRFTTKSGIKRELLLNISIINDFEGLNIGQIIIGTDITDMKKEQNRVRQQEKLAMIGQMAAGLVHEIKNPLAAIKGFSQLIEAKTNEDRTREYAKAIDRAISDLNKVVTDFLKFAKPMPPVMKELSLNELIMSVELLISTHAYNKGVSCAYTYSKEEMPIKADEGQLKQVVLNIVDNAIDAMSKSSMPQLRVSTELNKERMEMQLKISDNGKGMTPEEKLKVGTPFYTTKEKGTGLGMSICYQIASEHNGYIDIESQPEKGTTFIIILPCYYE